MLYKYNGRFTKAARLYRQALSSLIAAQGAEHPWVATLYHNLGGLEHARGNHARGEPFARRSVAIRQRVPGELRGAVGCVLLKGRDASQRPVVAVSRRFQGDVLLVVGAAWQALQLAPHKPTSRRK